ncbi:MAG TPA: glycosyltransferase family 39 protein [Vicinamibacterales bacterium]|nr:glycosyltransferase family 39 protein [Vicinamibacterales bacterium]
MPAAAPFPTTSAGKIAAAIGLGVLLFVVLFWRLGEASFWDPDEAHYAQATRELIATGDWLAPSYNGRPFFDKPILFYWLQAIPMSFLLSSEAAARLAPAISGLLLIGVTLWLGTELFGVAVGLTAALMVATNAGVFALARYAILDLPFTLFLFGGVAAVTVAMLQQRRRLEYFGYFLIGLANATKGPVALALCGLTFGLAAAWSRDARHQLLALRWVQGAVIAVLPGLLWPAYMIWRFGRDFVEGYILNENIRLFATPMYAGQPGWYFYLSIVGLGMLPWTFVLVARGADLVWSRRANGGADLPDVLLWSWVLAIVGFFSFSHFKLDHYVFPATPALCLICARAWHDLRDGRRGTTAVRWGVRGIGPGLVVAGIVVTFAALTVLDLDRSFLLVPAGVLACGIAATRYGWQPALPAIPLAPIVAMGVVFLGASGWVIPRLEEGKVVPDVARWVAAHAAPTDRVATFRLNRWNTAYRFYVERQVTVVESDEDARQFFSNTTPFYCVMTGQLFDALRSAGVPLRVAYEREGRWVTSGRALWRRSGDRTRFVVAVGAANQ